jgi:DNA polymerase III epsilon subunit-like protein
MFLIYDTETTSLLNFKLAADHPDQARIMQLGAILTDENLMPVASFCRLIKPWNWPKIAQEAIDTHGLTFERCMDEGVELKEVIEEFDTYADQMQAADGTSVAFNQQFDSKFIRGERRRLGREDRFGIAREFDPMKASTEICRLPHKSGRGGYKFPKLAEAYRILCGAEMAGAHDALADCHATRQIMVALRDRGVDIRGVPRESFTQPGEKPKPAPRVLPIGDRKISDTDLF